MDDNSSLKETEQRQEERSYVAFISYRHKPLDREAAVMIQKHIERYVVPKEFREKVGGKKLGIVFRDEDELPASSSLSDSITYALDHTQFLIVICTPDLPLSRWCEQEIRYFLKTHSRDNIIAVLADGEPDVSFSKYLLHDFDEEGNITADREPLAANIKGPDHTIDKKAFKKEIVRLYAALIGCPFDALWQRERRRKTNLIIGVLAGIMALLVAFLALVISNNMKITEKNREIEAQNETINEQNLNLQKQMSSMQVDAGQTALKNFDIKGAVENALAALGDGNRNIYDRRVEKLLTDITGAYSFKKKQSSIIYEQSTDIADILASPDEKHVFVSDQVGYVRNIEIDTGKLVWEVLTNTTSSKYGRTDLYLAQNGKILIARDNKVISGISPETGEIIWKYTYVMSEGTTMRAISPDGKKFALMDRIEGVYHFIQLDTENGNILTDTNVPYARVTTVTDHDWYAYGASYSKDSGLFVLAYYADDDEEQLYGYVYILIDTGTGEIKGRKLWEDECSARNIFYGITVENGTGNIFCTQYHSRYGSIVMLHIDWAKDENKLDKVNFSINEEYFLQDMGVVPMLWKEDVAVVFAERTVFIFDPRTQIMRKSYVYGGEIRQAHWLNEDEALFEMILENGQVWVYDLETESTTIFKYTSQDEFGQENVRIAESLNGGLCQMDHSADGMYLTVTGDAPGKLIAVREFTDSSVTYLEGFEPDDFYTIDYSVVPGTGDMILLLRYAEGDEVFVYGNEENRVVARYRLANHVSHNIHAIDRETLIAGNLIYHLGGEKEPFDGIQDPEDYTYSAYTMRNVQLEDGSVASATSVSYDYEDMSAGIYRIYYWLDGKMVTDSRCYEEGFVLKIADYEFVNPISGIGRNGYIYEAAKSKQNGVYNLYCFDIRNEKSYEMPLPCEFDEEILGCAGNSKAIMAVAGDEGKVFLGDIQTGSWTRLTQGYDKFEIKAISFTKGDEYLLVYTKPGRLDVFDTSSKALVYSDNLNEYLGDPQYVSKLEAEKDADILYLKVTSYSYEYGTWLKLDIKDGIVCQSTGNMMYHDVSHRKLYCRVNNDKVAWYPEKTIEMLREDAERIVEK